MVDVQGKWTLVTGASRGIGREIALDMARRGSNLVVHSRQLANTATLVKEVEALGVKCLPVACELSDESAVREMARSLLKKAPIDILFNNAGVQTKPQSKFYGLDSEAFLWSYKVNTLAPMILIEELLPHMLKQKFGRIINSTSGLHNQPEQSAYTASHSAIDKVTKELAFKLKGSGVIINLADPGWIKTDLGGPSATYEVKTVIPGSILGAFVQEEDIHGAWIPVQRFRGMTLEEAISLAPTLVK